MITGFWKKLKKPFFVLAPMADVTDCVFRALIAKYSGHGKASGGPDVFWTEFVSADGLCNEMGRKHLLIDLKYSEAERPIVAQLFGSNPENMEKASALVASLGFDGIDINMGCPDKTIEKQGAGAAMIKNLPQAKEIIRAVKRGAPNLPVSVKTRIGYNKNEIDTWVRGLLEEDLAALTIHARTRKEMSLVPARWEHVREVVDLKNKMGKDTLIIGNGDLLDIADARKKALETGCDGVMLGRAIFGNPWLFDEQKGIAVGQSTADDRVGLGSGNHAVTIEERLRVLVEHAQEFERVLCPHKSFAVMKKHFKAYVNGFDGAKELRMQLMNTENSKQVSEIIGEFLKKPL
ncbi:MAG: tRNA-dihydrouridine synthase [Patescibacteria group bacterium]